MSVHAEPSVPRPLPEGAVAAVRALARVSRLLERSSGELNLAHYRVLSAVAAGEERASRVAARLALGKPTVSAAVDALTQRGLLTRCGVDGDQRAAALALTPAGTELLDRVERGMAERVVALCDRTTEPARVLGSLAELGAAVDAVLADRVAAGAAR